MIANRRYVRVGVLAAGASLALVLTSIGENQTGSEAPTGFDNQTNGLVSQSSHDADAGVFQEVDTPDKGLGPVFNRNSCSTCHQDPTTGGVSTVAETRVGHTDSSGQFVNPTVVINGGKDTITGRSLINDNATCPQAKETVPATETIHAKRLSVSTLGDGFIEAVDDNFLLAIANRQVSVTGGAIRGQAVKVDVLEAPGTQRVGRFGWKDQHASLLSFAADAYLNEQGVTSRFLPTDVTSVCDTAPDPEDNTLDEEGFNDIDHFARFIRATKAPPVDAQLAAQPDAQAGSQLFDQIGCGLCHLRSLRTVPAGTAINGGTFTVPDALGGKVFHPFSDLLLHDVGTGDGIVQNGGQSTANKLRTTPLWGLRKRTLLMHDGGSRSRTDAILRHGGEARPVTEGFQRLNKGQQKQLLKFLDSL